MGLKCDFTTFRSFHKKVGDVYWEEALRLQAEVICEPLLRHFKDAALPEWHHYLLAQGLRKPSGDWTKFGEVLQKKGHIKELQKHFFVLKKKWSGPDLPIYLLPIDTTNEELRDRLAGKNGVTFADFIVLFIDESLSLNAMKALLTHEYNHACRLFYQKKNEESVTLMESMLMEGLAEAAVKNHLGKSEQAPWTRTLSREQCEDWWKQVLSHRKDIKGRRYHAHWMYGGRNMPRMIGYVTGFYIVQDFLEKNPEISERGCLKKEADDILAGSGWNSG
ncbi:DUF2268 domain-containing protein [Alteribacter keqinensis]|uniref:DUF2268 domain-containing protein n=1 Tax=Alteribacter keqinensis TaxID=2483800 RepID=A0A3M7TWL1_9BACI|nr:DUF2268 domain-containing putative Zn-dependent protease [Alteribacter keqinensis]RNA69968.1 hypothetical protein EBO34_08560 [Alteribacter keqinensis]